MKAVDINVRDPFVLPYEGVYYLYGTRGETTFGREAFGFDVYTSTDLENWEGPHEIFHRPENFWSKECYWAPEVHVVNGKFYMFATFADLHGGLGTTVLTSDSPKGPFVMISDGYVTPKGHRCLDGTLYVSKAGKPYMVFCNEWMEIHDGTVCAIPLTEDLSAAAGEPRILFHATDGTTFIKEYTPGNYVTDGPYLVRTEDDKLHMLWSSFAETGYVEAGAHSDNDEIDGSWTVDAELLYDHDGGHGMIFKDFEGNYRMTLHYPNTEFEEHPIFINLAYENGRFRVK